MNSVLERKKGSYLTQFYSKRPDTKRIAKKQSENTKMPPKTSITQRLRVGVATSTK